MTVWVCLDGDAGAEGGGMVFEVSGGEVGVEGVGDVGGDEEGVCVGLGEEVGG